MRLPSQLVVGERRVLGHLEDLVLQGNCAVSQSAASARCVRSRHANFRDRPRRRSTILGIAAKAEGLHAALVQRTREEGKEIEVQLKQLVRARRAKRKAAKLLK